MKASDYLIKKLETLGIEEIFGLPGDFNFKIVESVIHNQKVKWIGNTNELNAGYSAEGYSRIKGYGAIITTFGVGEMSAINAVCCAMSENLPLIKITGMPKTSDIKNNSLLHHNIVDNNNNPKYKAFYKAYKNVVQYAKILNKNNVKKEIDKAIDILVKYKKPVYLAMPIDVCDVEIEENEKDFIIKNPSSNPKNLENAAKAIIKEIKKSKEPFIIADVLVKRFNGKKALNDFLYKTKIPSMCLLRGLGIIDGDVKNYLKTFCGTIGNKIAYDYYKKSDCIIALGTVISDLSTMNFSYNGKCSIKIEPYCTTVKGKKYKDVLLKDIIEKLYEEIDYSYEKEIVNDFEYEKMSPTDEPLTSEYIYSTLEEFLKPKDIFVTEVGLIPYGSMKMKFPKDVTVENQMLWGSIGWAGPCAQGCQFASKERRTIVVSGDGSHQLTAQEISTMMRYKIKPIVFIINNSGYTIERMLCDNIEYEYNDIAKWDYSKLPDVFEGECFSAKAETKEQLYNLLEKIEKENKDKMCYIELKTHYLDAPNLIKGITEKKVC